MPSLYALYIKERENREMLETEHGFAIYSVSGVELYLQDLFVTKEQRNTGEGKKMLERLIQIGRDSGCKIMTTSVVPTTEGSTLSMKLSVNYGFKLLKAEPNFIVLYLDLQEK